MKPILALIGAMTLAAVTPTLAAPKAPAKAASAAPKCFMARDIAGHTIGNERTLYLKVGGASVYRVDMSNNCFGGAGPTDPITITSRGSSSICGEQDLEVGATVNGGGLSSRCVIDKLTRLSPAEATALPKGLKP